MSQNHIKVSVNHDNSSRYGFTVSPNTPPHRGASELTKSIMSAMGTRRASGAFRTIALRWDSAYHANINPDSEAQNFQRLLLQASQDSSRWSTIILHWVDHTLAASFSRDTPASENATEFSMSNHYIRLNGHVSALSSLIRLYLCR
jgi:hypothetical protein